MLVVDLTRGLAIPGQSDYLNWHKVALFIYHSWLLDEPSHPHIQLLQFLFFFSPLIL